MFFLIQRTAEPAPRWGVVSCHKSCDEAEKAALEISGTAPGSFFVAEGVSGVKCERKIEPIKTLLAEAARAL